MTQPHPYHTPPTQPKRDVLARYLGRTVTAEGTLMRPYRNRNGKHLRLVQRVIVYPHIELQYAWVALPSYVLRGVRLETRFTFKAVVEEYKRTDGSWEYGLAFAEWVR